MRGGDSLNPVRRHRALPPRRCQSGTAGIEMEALPYGAIQFLVNTSTGKYFVKYVH